MFVSLLIQLVCFGSCLHAGVDIGSFYTKGSTVNSNEQPEIATNYETKRLTPTFLAFKANPKFNLSSNATIRSKEVADIFPFMGDKALSIMSIRPWMGSGLFPYFLNIEQETAEELGKYFFVNLTAARVQWADLVPLYYKMYLNCILRDRPLKDLAFVIPASLTIPQRNYLMSYLHIAGYEQVKFIEDSDAVIYTYANEKISTLKTFTKTVLFVDIGATSIKAYSIKFHVPANRKIIATKLSYQSDYTTGGAFITRKIVDLMVEKFKLTELSDPEYRRLFDAAERVKKELTLVEEAPISIENIAGQDRVFTLSREELIKCSEDFITKLKQLMEDAHKGFKVDEVEMFGGSSRLHFLSHTFSEYNFGHSLNPDETLALGASYYHQFSHEVSKYTKPEISEDVPSIYNMTFTHKKGSEHLCDAGGKCPKTITAPHDAKFVSIVYDDPKLRPGIKSKSFGFNISPQEATKTIEVKFQNRPFNISRVQVCAGKKCRDMRVRAIEIPKTTSVIFKALQQVEAERAQIAKVVNQIENYVQASEDALMELNCSFMNFTNHIQRDELRNTTRETKRWVRVNGSECTNYSEFKTQLANIKGKLDPIRQRMAENATIYTAMDEYNATLRLGYTLLNETFSKIEYLKWDDLDKFRKMLNETEQYLKRADNFIHALPIHISHPFKTATFNKYKKMIDQEIKRLNNTKKPKPAQLEKILEDNAKKRAEQEKKEAEEKAKQEEEKKKEEAKPSKYEEEYVRDHPKPTDEEGAEAMTKWTEGLKEFEEKKKKEEEEEEKRRKEEEEEMDRKYKEEEHYNPQEAYAKFEREHPAPLDDDAEFFNWTEQRKDFEQAYSREWNENANQRKKEKERQRELEKERERGPTPPPNPDGEKQEEKKDEPLRPEQIFEEFERLHPPPVRDGPEAMDKWHEERRAFEEQKMKEFRERLNEERQRKIDDIKKDIPHPHTPPVPEPIPDGEEPIPDGDTPEDIPIPPNSDL